MNRLVKRLTDNGSKLSKIFTYFADYCESKISEDDIITEDYILSLIKEFLENNMNDYLCSDETKNDIDIDGLTNNMLLALINDI